jgi:urease accessory protein
LTAERQARCFDLEFGVDGRGRSFLGAQFVRYPVHVCRGLRVDEGDPAPCSVALQSVSGGLFEGDHVAGGLHVRPGARARVSTSASTIVHRMRGEAGARQSVVLRADAGARLEYLPEPLILFPGSRLRSDTCVHLADGARVVLCESFLLHDPQAAERAFETLDVRVEVRDAAGRLRARERMLLQGAAWAESSRGLPGHPPVHASLWLLGADSAGLIAPVRAALERSAAYAGASELPDGLGVQVRMLAEDAVGLRQCLGAVLDLARPEVPAR